MPYIQVAEENSGAVKLHYEDHGAGQPVVLIHGFPLSGAAWEKQESVLIEAGYRVIAYDRRGFGKSSQPAFGYDYDTFADDLNELLSKLDLRDAVLIGHSMGTGEIARVLGIYGSARVTGAVFISPLQPFLLRTGDNPDGVDAKLFDSFKREILRDRFQFLTQFFLDFFNFDLTRGKDVSDQAFQFNWNLGASASARATHDCVTSWTTDFRNDVAKIEVPSLIIHGTADRIIPFKLTAARLEKMIPGSRLVSIDGAPHGIPWTHADIINRELLEFLPKLEAKRGAA
jgi:non-heme chloroperoxidase